MFVVFLLLLLISVVSHGNKFKRFSFSPQCFTFEGNRCCIIIIITIIIIIIIFVIITVFVVVVIVVIMLLLEELFINFNQETRGIINRMEGRKNGGDH